jgi:hypothetical protein
MGESHKLSDLGGMEGSVGSMRGRGRRSRHVVGNVNLPEAVGGIAAVASQDGFIIVGDGHGMLGESGCAVSVTELTNGKQGRMQVVKGVGLGGGQGKPREAEMANRIGGNGGAIGESHRDGRRVS